MTAVSDWLKPGASLVLLSQPSPRPSPLWGEGDDSTALTLPVRTLGIIATTNRNCFYPPSATIRCRGDELVMDKPQPGADIPASSAHADISLKPEPAADSVLSPSLGASQGQYSPDG